MTMISLEDSAWSRSYAVWSQLATEPPIAISGGPVSNGGEDAILDHLRAEDRTELSASTRPRPDHA